MPPPSPHRSRAARHKLGLPPGTLVFTGVQKVPEATGRLIEYDEATLVEHPLDLADLPRFRDDPRVSWVDVEGLHDVGWIRAIGETFGLHPLLLEDILTTHQRAKVEVFPDALFLAVSMLRVEEGRMVIEQVSLAVGPTWVLTFQERPGDVFEPIRERLRQARGHVRGRDAAYLAYALLDVIVDHYFVVLEHLADRIERVEDEVIDDPRPDLQRAIRELHRDLVAVRKAVWPVREVVTQFQRADCSFLHDDLQPFLRDLYDHAVHTIDLVESLRELLSGLRDSYQTALGNRMNEVMKLLTIIGTIFIPLTFIVGVYGMNFDVMPELRQPAGYPVTLLGMATIAGGLLVFFRRKGWM